MSAFVSFTAKPGCEDRINEAYAKLTKGREPWLIYSQRVIKEEIAYIHSPEGEGSFSHVRSSLHTVEDWNRIFPDYALGSGFVRVNPRGVDNSAEVKRVARFVIDSRELFDKVEGLDAICSNTAQQPTRTRGKAA